MMKWSNSVPLFSTKERSWGHGSYLPCVYLRVKIILGVGHGSTNMWMEYRNFSSGDRSTTTWIMGVVITRRIESLLYEVGSQATCVESYLQLLYCYTKFSCL